MWTAPDGREILRFYHFSIEVAEMTSEDLFMKGLPGILPFVPFTRDGKRREVIEKAIMLLLPAHDIIKRELLALTQLLRH